MSKITLDAPESVTKDAPSTEGRKMSVQPSVNPNVSNQENQSPTSTLRNRAGAGHEGDEGAWGANFWVTLVDPQTQTSFYACPATGQVSWDPPVGNFVLPPSPAGEWWELTDDSRGGLPYYYQTKTGETVWERPEGFVIPLGIIQNTALGRRLSQTTFKRFSASFDFANAKHIAHPGNSTQPTVNRSKSFSSDNAPIQSSPTSSVNTPRSRSIRRSVSDDRYSSGHGLPNGSKRPHGIGGQLAPIPGSPYATERSSPPSPSSSRSSNFPSSPNTQQNGTAVPIIYDQNEEMDAESRSRLKSATYSPHRQQPQSLQAAAEILSNPQSDGGHDAKKHTLSLKSSVVSGSSYRDDYGEFEPSARGEGSYRHDPSPTHKLPPSTPNKHLPTVAGKQISGPIMNHAATQAMSPIKNRAAGKPILVEPFIRPSLAGSYMALSSGTYPFLPEALASDIQQFSESDYAKQYFSTHRSGFIFRRRVPVEQMMSWQKSPLTSPLLMLTRALHKDAVKVFKVIQQVMGDREREKPVRLHSADNYLPAGAMNTSSVSLASNLIGAMEGERWLLSEGLTHGELRDEIYCQLMKQLTGNPSTESIFKGWQLLCVLLITFPPSKNFETYLHAFIQKHTTHQEGRVDIMANHCLRRLSVVSKKGPRGKPPTFAEIEAASDAAFNPSIFGESLDAIVRLQKRNYPQQKVPIILPFLADGILALGGPKSEGIFRVPGDGDSVSELKLRIDRGYYTLDSVDDPHVLASLMKLWLRELCDPLIPDEMYNECIENSKDWEACVRIVQRLPTINRRVVMFVISFLQLFLDERTQVITKMTPANLALVMAPNLLRCNSDSMSIVFTNAQYEQIFVYNLLLHLRCNEVDDGYKPTHGLGAVSTAPPPRTSKLRSRRPN